VLARVDDVGRRPAVAGDGFRLRRRVPLSGVPVVRGERAEALLALVGHVETTFATPGKTTAVRSLERSPGNAAECAWAAGRNQRFPCASPAVHRRNILLPVNDVKG